MQIKISRVLMAVLNLFAPLLFMNTLAQGQIEQQQQQSPPVVDAGLEQIVNEGDRVTLTGTSSFDPDGKIVSYAWGIEDSDDESPAIV